MFYLVVIAGNMLGIRDHEDVKTPAPASVPPSPSPDVDIEANRSTGASTTAGATAGRGMVTSPPRGGHQAGNLGAADDGDDEDGFAIPHTLDRLDSHDRMGADRYSPKGSPRYAAAPSAPPQPPLFQGLVTAVPVTPREAARTYRNIPQTEAHYAYDDDEGDDPSISSFYGGNNGSMTYDSNIMRSPGRTTAGRK
jgi:hypothetical protein